MKKKFTSIILSALIAAAPLSAFAVAETASAFDGYLYFTAERSTLGQGLICEPEKVGFYKDENLTQITKRFLGDTAVFTGGDSSAYLTAIKDGGAPQDWNEECIPDEIYAYVEDYIDNRAEADTLAAEDYTPYSGYMYTIDNVSMNTYSSSVVLGDDTSGGMNFKDGSVVRIMYSIYGWGFDVGLGYEGMGFEWESENTFADRSALIKRVADIKADGLIDKYDEDYKDAVELLAEWDVDAEDMNNQLELLTDADPNETDPDETDPDETDPDETATVTDTKPTEPTVTEPESKPTEPTVTEPESKPTEPTVPETETKGTIPTIVTVPAKESETQTAEASSTENTSVTKTQKTEPTIVTIPPSVTETQQTETQAVSIPEATTVPVATETVSTQVKVSKLTLNVKKKTLNVGKSFNLKAKISPSNASNKTLSFRVANKKLAKVTKSGKVTAKAKGTTYIIVKTTDGSNLSAKCKLTIKQPVKKITVKYGKKTVNNKTIKLKIGQKITLKPIVSPSNANNKGVTWTVKNKNIAVIKNGKLTAKSKGTTVVTVKAKDGSKVQTKVTIKIK